MDCSCPCCASLPSCFSKQYKCSWFLQLVLLNLGSDLFWLAFNQISHIFGVASGWLLFQGGFILALVQSNCVVPFTSIYIILFFPLSRIFTLARNFCLQNPLFFDLSVATCFCDSLSAPPPTPGALTYSSLPGHLRYTAVYPAVVWSTYVYGSTLVFIPSFALSSVHLKVVVLGNVFIIPAVVVELG